ncbi:MAG TPA: TIGR00282 family metallophosphoesterase [Vicinamibacterales bacterium]|nr:TIGR00282 family metallophosphoesterase [Vicinamibacterales bacterium]
MTRLLFIGDICGKPGRELLRRGLASLVRQRGIDLVVANGENAAAGFGITPDIADDLFSYGIHVLTGGNHSWDKKEIVGYMPDHARLLRPANFPAGAPGAGRVVVRATNGVSVAVINVMGRVFMTPIDDPFRVVLDEIRAVRDEASIILVDMHAEATSEKVAMGWHLDGQATVVVGTHTHVQTADARVLPQGTAYITDVGMTGPHDSVIGVDRTAIIQRFLSGRPQRFETATGNPRINAVVVDADEAIGRAVSIERLDLSADDVETLVAQPATAG